MNIARLFAVVALLPVIALGGAVLGMVAGVCRVIDFVVASGDAAAPLFGELSRGAGRGVSRRAHPVSA